MLRVEDANATSEIVRVKSMYARRDTFVLGKEVEVEKLVGTLPTTPQ
jgi:hypothetical protein